MSESQRWAASASTDGTGPTGEANRGTASGPVPDESASSAADRSRGTASGQVPGESVSSATDQSRGTASGSMANGAGSWGERARIWLSWRTPASERAILQRAPRLRREIWIVMGLSLGQSAVYAVISLVAKLTAGPPLAAQTATLNASRSTREYLDLTYQIAAIAFALVPVALALYLLWSPARSGARRIGLDLANPARDLAHGVGLAAAVGLPGCAFYLLARWMGLNVNVQASGLGAFWWSVPILILAAIENALVEEVIMIGYLYTRLRELGWSRWQWMLTSALIRGTYHLYQGFGAFIGNAVMGLVFGWYFERKGRVMPLVVAHTVMDVVVFVGYWLLPGSLRELL